MSTPTHRGGLMTPVTKPSIPTVEPPNFILPPSLPNESYIIDSNAEPGSIGVGRGRRTSVWDSSQPRSLTNNDHCHIPSSYIGNDGAPIAQSPTILSILSSSDHSHVPSHNTTILGSLTHRGQMAPSSRAAGGGVSLNNPSFMSLQHGMGNLALQGTPPNLPPPPQQYQHHHQQQQSINNDIDIHDSLSNYFDDDICQDPLDDDLPFEINL